MIILLLSFIALAAAVRQPQPSPSFDTQSAKVCTLSTVACAARNGSCDATTSMSSTGTVTTTYYTCPSNTLATSLVVFDVPHCFCRPYTQLSPVLGGNCTIGDTKFAPDGWQCEQSQVSGDSNYYWFSDKTEGDICSNIYDCSPPRRCVNNLCYNSLVRGDTCYNITASPTIDLTTSCSVKDYCPSSGDARICTARVTAMSTCTDINSCPPYQQCLAQDGTTTGTGTKTCVTPPLYWIPAGQAANSSQAQCASGMWDGAVNMTCLNYAEIYALYLPIDGSVCTDTTACSFGTCACGAGTVANCYWNKPTTQTLRDNYAAKTAKDKMIYDTGCEAIFAVPTSSNNDYCVVRAGYYTKAATSTVCNGATSISSSMITIIAAMLVALVSSSRW